MASFQSLSSAKPSRPRARCQINCFSVISARPRLSKDSYVQPSQPRMPSTVNDPEIIDQFRLHRDRESESRPFSALTADDDEIQKQISYTREQKLAAISYAMTTWKSQKDGSLKLISKYSAAQNLGITTKMLRS